MSLSPVVDCLRRLVELLHQPRLAAGSFVLVDDAFLSCLVQGNDSEMRLFSGLLDLSLSDKLPGLIDKGSSSGTKRLIALSLPGRAPDSFDS